MDSLDVGPVAGGVRLPWADVPEALHGWVEAFLGSPVVQAQTQPGGFSPGVAARLRCADGSRAFVKAVSSLANPRSPDMHRAEARIGGSLPTSAPVPRLLASYDDGTWVALLFADVDGRQPALPWRADELDRVLRALAEMAELLTPSPLPELPTVAERLAEDFTGWRLLAGGETPANGLDAWSRRHLDRLAQLETLSLEAASGETLLHCDLRADNLLLEGVTDRVWVVDWPWACRGAAFVDIVAFAPSVAMQGGPPPEEVLDRSAGLGSDPAGVDAVLCGLAGLFTERSLRPASPGLPTLRAFQAAQGRVARAWLARRTGWA